MLVYRGAPTGSPQAHFHFFDFERYQDDAGTFVFIPSPQVFTKVDIDFLKDNKLVYLELEEPNRFFVNEEWFHHFDYDQYFDLIFSICPYTTDWLNKVNGDNTRRHTFIPINLETIPQQKFEKEYDIMYAGHLVSNEIRKDVENISGFHYCFVSNDNDPLVTHRGASNEAKLELMKKSKITLTHGLLYPQEQHIAFLTTIPGYKDNQAFNRLDQGIVPQIKGRTFEAALCRSLILCKKDPWNVIEYYFKPGVDFIYFEENKLQEIVRDIVDSYDKYTPIVDSAYEKALGYTAESFFKKNLKDLQ